MVSITVHYKINGHHYIFFLSFGSFPYSVYMVSNIIIPDNGILQNNNPKKEGEMKFFLFFLGYSLI